MTPQSHSISVGMAVTVRVGTNMFNRDDRRECFLHYFDLHPGLASQKLKLGLVPAPNAGAGRSSFVHTSQREGPSQRQAR